MGHGGEVLRQVYSLALERQHVVEVTVEDPAPGFVKLRDATDVGHCRRLGAFGTPSAGEEAVAAAAAALTEEEVVPLPAGAMASAQALTKLTPAQITLAHDALTFSRIEPATQKGVYKRFRLMVKRRLNTAHKVGENPEHQP